MLYLEPGDRERFADAFAKLIGSIEDEQWRIRLAAVLSVAVKWQAEGRELPWNTDAILYSAMVRIVLQHLFQGFPLALPISVIQAYVEAGERLETPLHDCAECGYGLPRSFTTCPLCSGQVGPGASQGIHPKKATGVKNTGR